MQMRKLISLTAAVSCAMCFIGCDSQKDNQKEIKEYTSIFAVYGDDKSPDNTIQQLIAEKTGAKCIETWLDDSKNFSDIMDQMIQSDSYPDFIYAGNDHQKFLDAGAYIPIDKYWDDCKNIKNYFTAEEWDKIREDDGHIYIIPVFSNVYMYDTNTVHDDEAFWIQSRVLKWAGYPEINTLDEYFDLIEGYLKANPVNEDGSANIGYDIVTDGYLYFCLENVPAFLDGQPNNGCCIVDKDTLEAKDYNTTDTAKRWFKKLNEEYQKGVIDPECFVLTATQYFDKLASGNVLGMVDQHWNFAPYLEELPSDRQYVPLGIVIDEGIEEHYHSEVAFNSSAGLGVSVSCDDPKGALKFIDNLLDPEILNLRYWGVEGKDYNVDENGIFYLTDEQLINYYDSNYRYKNRCEYNFFPYYKGMNQDGINAFSPLYQPEEFYKTLSPEMQECLGAYGAKTYVEMLNKSEDNEPWYPMWAYLNTWTDDTASGQARINMDELKHEYLPKIVMSKDFESAWSDYMKVYNQRCDIKAYLDDLTSYVRKSVGK